MNIKLATIVNFLAKPVNMIGDNELKGFWVCKMPEGEIKLEDLQKAVIHLKDAVDVMKPLENYPLRLEIHHFTTAFLFLESARDALLRASIPNAARAMNKVIKNIKTACKTKSAMYQKILIAGVLDSLNRVLRSVEKSVSDVVTPIVTHMTYEELLSKLTAYSSGTIY
ncbi:MAG: hypothetical protein SWZ49_11620 [Cyanobacteriota bacterium]|nr:hypothetical protein [Cyanobacteriota bacterium]